MRNRLHHLRRDERGMSFVFVGMGFMAFLAATTLAIDVGMFMTARSQAQNAADAGAHAGAVALALNSFTDRSSTGPAVQSAVNTAQANKVMGQAPSVTPDDVTFPVAPSGAANRVKVNVFRTAERGTAVPTLIGTMFGRDVVDITATATAEASPANAMTCVKPFMIPDKWIENGTPPWDTTDTFDMYDNKGNLLPAAIRDVYIPARDCLTCADNPGYTGYSVANDKGMRLVLRAGTGANINPSFYYSWKMPGDTGGNFYRDNIATCNQSIIRWGTDITQEPGNMVGPTIDGVTQLIAKDPGAYWEGRPGCNCVRGSKFSGQSPRVFPIPLYDPAYYASGKANGRPADFRVANFLGFFAEYIQGNEIFGYITNVTGIVDPNAPSPTGLFPMAIRLVQ